MGAHPARSRRLPRQPVAGGAPAGHSSPFASTEARKGSRAGESPRMTATAAARRGALVAFVLLMAGGASPHEVAVEQIVGIDMAIQGDRLVVRMHVPETALADARLP